MGTRAAARSKVKAKRIAQQQRTLRNRAKAEGNTAGQATDGGAAAEPRSGGPFLDETSTVKQVAAAAYVLGQSVGKTAEALGVDRRTVQRWSKFDPEFQSALTENKQELIVISRHHLLAVSEAAVELVESKLSDGKSSKIAVTFLRGVGVFGANVNEMPPSLLQEMENGAQSATCPITAHNPPGTDELTEDGLDPADIVDSLPAEVGEVYEFASLPAAQQDAVLTLFHGKTISESAQLTATSASTIRHWLCHDLRFFTVLQEMQFERVNRLKFRLLRLMETAVQIVRQGILAGDGRLAITMLRGLGLLK